MTKLFMWIQNFHNFSQMHLCGLKRKVATKDADTRILKVGGVLICSLFNRHNLPFLLKGVKHPLTSTFFKCGMNPSLPLGVAAVKSFHL